MRLTLGSYVLGSTVIAATVVAHTIMTREQYYLVAVNLVANKGKLMALGNMGFVFAILFAKLMIKLFLGTLREEEWENLNDRVSSTFIDTLLAMTIFRGDFGASFIVLFVLLLSSKIFHWTVQDRVDYIERTPLLSRLTYLRVFTFIFLLAVFDLIFVFYAATITKTRGASIMLLFGFEYAVLFALSLQSMAKFFLNLEDMRREGRWDQKGAYVLYIDFVTDTFKLVVYFMFFSFVMMYYGMPFHLIRQMYMTFRSFQRKVKELMQYRRATANMNQRFPDATAEEIANAHGVCIVCREEMTAAKKLPCSHVLHFHCLRSWLERSQTCPMCTASVLEERPQQQRQQPAQQQPQQQAQQQAQQQQAQQPQAHAHQHHHQQPQAHQRPILPPSFTLPFIPPAAQAAQQTTGSQSSTQPAQADPNLNLPEGFENMMYESPLVHVARIQQQLEFLQLETQLLWQTIFMQQQMFMQQMVGGLPQFNGNNNNDQNNNQNNPSGFNLPNMNTNTDNNNTNTSINTNTANNTNNTNNSDTTTTTTSTNTLPRINSDDELLRQVMKESARTQTVTSSPPRTTTTSFSTSLPSSPSSTSAPSLPTSPSASSTPTSPSPDDEDKDSLRRRRLMKFSASNE